MADAAEPRLAAAAAPSTAARWACPTARSTGAARAARSRCAEPLLMAGARDPRAPPLFTRHAGRLHRIGQHGRALARGWGEPVLAPTAAPAGRRRWPRSSAARRSRPTASWPSAPTSSILAHKPAPARGGRRRDRAARPKARRLDPRRHDAGARSRAAYPARPCSASSRTRRSRSRRGVLAFAEPDAPADERRADGRASASSALGDGRRRAASG